MKLMLTMAIIGLTVTALDGCNNQAGPKNGTTPTTTAAVATLQQQKLCADQADKSFKESAFSDGHSTFTDHFDPADGVCYMEITTRNQIGPNFQYSLLIYDAFEGRVYGGFNSLSSEAKPLECSLKPRNLPDVRCNSSDEFNDFALKHFGTTPD
jgi:hypothetical protein